MIAMQYSFVLPADYDMNIIAQRIKTRGPALDNLDGLLLKSYLTTTLADGGEENSYAPFYVWQNTAAMNQFLCGPGFAALTQAFGWPVVKTWSVLSARISPQVRSAKAATRLITPIPAYTDLAGLLVEAPLDTRALAEIQAFEPCSWQRVFFQLWPGDNPPSNGAQRYTVGHVSAPGLTRK